MLLTLAGLFALALVVFIAWRLITWFWAWLGRGKTTTRAIDRHLVSDELVEARASLDRWRLLSHERRLHVKKPKFLSLSQLKELWAAERMVRNEYLDNLTISWYQVVILFFVGSIAGLLLEELWMLVAWGVAQSRPGLVWGPFSPMYGVGVVLMTLITFRMRKYKAHPAVIFLIAAALGGSLEQFTGWWMETSLGAVSWDYSHLSTAITKWVAWPFVIMWGLIGLMWYWIIMPELLYRIGEANTRRKAVFVGLLSVYLACDVAMTLACFNRRAARDEGIPPANSFDMWVDENFSDEFMSARFQNMMFNGQDMGITPRLPGI